MDYISGYGTTIPVGGNTRQVSAHQGGDHPGGAARMEASGPRLESAGRRGRKEHSEEKTGGESMKGKCGGEAGVFDVAGRQAGRQTSSQGSWMGLWSWASGDLEKFCAACVFLFLKGTARAFINFSRREHHLKRIGTTALGALSNE